MCLIYFLSSLLFYYSFTMISKKYTLVVGLWFACWMKAMTAFVAGIASFALSLFSMSRAPVAARGFLAVEFVIIFFVFVRSVSWCSDVQSCLVYCVTRIQTILRIVPENRSSFQRCFIIVYSNLYWSIVLLAYMLIHERSVADQFVH